MIKIVPTKKWKRFATGIFRDIPAEVYHDPSGGLSRTIAAKIAFESPAHALHEMHHPEPPTIFMEMGSLVHLSCLEPEKLKGSYFVRPAENEDGDSWDGRKIWCKEWVKAHASLPRLSPEQEQQVLGCTAALRANPTMAGMLAVGHPELSVYADYQGTILRCRPDLIAEDIDGKIWVLDIKKCQDASLGAFSRQSRSLHRDFQEAWYRMVLKLAGVTVDRFVFAAVEEKPPHGVGLYRIAEKNIMDIQPSIHYAIDLWRQCVETGNWPGYTASIQEVAWRNFVWE